MEGPMDENTQESAEGRFGRAREYVGSKYNEMR